MTRRTALKGLHWLGFLMSAWFWLIEPEEVERMDGAALATLAGMGTGLALLNTA